MSQPSQPVVPKDHQNASDMDFSNFDIPIFTEEFLDHNKTRDAELRQLRKSNTDYEQQNSILQKHIESMKSANEKLENEIMQQRKNNSSLQRHLDHLRTTLTNGFSGVKLPGRVGHVLKSCDYCLTKAKILPCTFLIFLMTGVICFFTFQKYNMFCF